MRPRVDDDSRAIVTAIFEDTACDVTCQHEMQSYLRTRPDPELQRLGNLGKYAFRRRLLRALELGLLEADEPRPEPSFTHRWYWLPSPTEDEA